MKQNINFIVKLALLSILILLFVVIWYKTSTVEMTIEQQSSETTFESSISSDIPKEPLPKISSEPDLIEPVVKDSKSVSKTKQYKAWEKEHFYAAKVFKYFIKKGFTAEATAGILGNMMIETSGGVLDLKPNIYSKSRNYYGLCQWSKQYYPEAHGLSFSQQLDYLLETMPREFKTFGWLYKEGFNFEDFIQMNNPEEAALAFAKVYERCGPASHSLRKQAAKKAYNYFTLEHPI